MYLYYFLRYKSLSGAGHTHTQRQLIWVVPSLERFGDDVLNADMLDLTCNIELSVNAMRVQNESDFRDNALCINSVGARKIIPYQSCNIASGSADKRFFFSSMPYDRHAQSKKKKKILVQWIVLCLFIPMSKK